MTDLTEEAVKALLDDDHIKFFADRLLEVARIKAATEPYEGECDQEDLASYAGEVVKLRRALLDTRAELDRVKVAALAEVQALRVEARENAMQALASMGQAQEAYEAQLEAEAELARVRADAAVAVALMVERAAEQADPWDGPVTKNKIVDAQAIVAQQVKARIRALAPDAGTAELAKLRERAEKAEQERVAEWNRRRDADGSRDAARAACDTMRAERDTLAAENASLKAAKAVAG